MKISSIFVAFLDNMNFIRKNLHTVDIFSTTYLPHLVNVVKERPQMGKKELKKASNLSAYLQKIMEISFF